MDLGELDVEHFEARDLLKEHLDLRAESLEAGAVKYSLLRDKALTAARDALEPAREGV